MKKEDQFIKDLKTVNTPYKAGSVYPKTDFYKGLVDP